MVFNAFWDVSNSLVVKYEPKFCAIFDYKVKLSEQKYVQLRLDQRHFLAICNCSWVR